MSGLFYLPLIAGIDTLEIGYCIGTFLITEEEFGLIQNAKDRAQATLYDPGTGITFKGHEFIVKRVGTGRHRFILSNGDLEILIHPESKSGQYFPEVVARFRSQYLWRHGWQAAVREVDRWVNSWAFITAVKVSRLDITVDLMGEFPVLSPELTEVVTRTKKKKEYGNYERYTDGAIRTGYRFGEHELMCRIYDKTKEIYRSEKTWFKAMWIENGWEEGETVVRVEFQCGRKIIKEMNIKSIEDMIRVVPDLWKYLTEEWLTIRVIGNDSHRTRWAMSELWVSVQRSVEWFGEVTGVSRIKQLRARAVNQEALTRGHILNFIALATKSQGTANIDGSIYYFEQKVREWIEDPLFAQEIIKRRHKYDSMED